MQSSRAIVFLALLGLSMANLTAAPFQKGRIPHVEEKAVAPNPVDDPSDDRFRINSEVEREQAERPNPMKDVFDDHLWINKTIEDKEPELQKAIMQQNVSKRTDRLSGEALKINDKSTNKCFLLELMKCLAKNVNFTIKKIQHKDYLIMKRKNENNNKTCISATENSIIERVYHTTPTPSTNFVTEYQTANHHIIPRLGASSNEIDTSRNKHDLLDGLKLVKIGQDTEEVQDVPKINKIGHNTWRPYASHYPMKPHIKDSFEGMQRKVTNQLQRRKLGPYIARMRTNPRNIQNTLHRLQLENYLLLKTRPMSYTQPNEITHKARGVTFPGLNRMSKFLSHKTKYPNTLSYTVRYPGGASILTPYPYMRNSENKNVIFQTDIGKSSSLVSKPIPQIDNTEFSDEMKRELRDDKVILLSGNDIHSDFEPEKEKNVGIKETTNISSEEEKVYLQHWIFLNAVPEEFKHR